METPICDFVDAYQKKDALRLHMPGHKGKAVLGCEPYDITEIAGADSLYEADGIIGKSEENAGRLFGCTTFYATEGSSQCIKAMLYLATQGHHATGSKPRIAAGRNAHKAFLQAAALLDFDIDWLCPATEDSYLSCRITAEGLEAYFATTEHPPLAVYLTSPDYLGNCLDIGALGQVCHRHGALLLVDNAHGAYLKFLKVSRHPMELGADLCCDSAHKTLPVLTGGAYLHIANGVAATYAPHAKAAMALFGSTSPSYLILQSLDAANRYLEGHAARLAAFLPAVDRLKEGLQARGITFLGDEPLKLTICTKPYGYYGTDFAERLAAYGITSEFSDPDFVVLMLTPEIDASGFEQILAAVEHIERKPPISVTAPTFHLPKRHCSVREAMLSYVETIPVEQSIGRVIARDELRCPPAVPIAVCGEEVDAAVLKRFAYYQIKTCTVMR